MSNANASQSKVILNTSSRPNSFLARLPYLLSQNWITLFLLILGIYVGLPFLAPVFMQIGWEIPGRGLYFLYSFLCHQLPQRSFFLFGPQTMYSLAEIQSAGGQDITNLFTLRHFIGNPVMGWKVAWSDRMVSMFTATLLFGLLWRPLLRKLKSLPWWGLLLFLLPMAVDGATHFASDLAGIGQGFRDSNAWLAALTNQAFSPAFYGGDALGSFNSWMRLITGVFFGLGVVWFGFPYLEQAFKYVDYSLDIKNTSPASRLDE